MPRYTAPIVLALLALMVGAPAAPAAPARHRCHRHHRHVCRHARRRVTPTPNSSSRAQPATGAVAPADAPEDEVPFSSEEGETRTITPQELVELEARLREETEPVAGEPPPTPQEEETSYDCGADGDCVPSADY